MPFSTEGLMKKLSQYALTGAMVAALAATTIAVTVEVAAAKTRIPLCDKVKLGSDKTTARQIAITWQRLGPLSGMCAKPGK
jgi:hypothetical protein